MVLDTNDIQCIIFKFLFYQFEEFTIVFKFTIDTLIADRHGIRQGDGDFDQDGFVVDIIVAIQTGDKFLLSLVSQSPKNGIIPSDVE